MRLLKLFTFVFIIQILKGQYNLVNVCVHIDDCNTIVPLNILQDKEFDFDGPIEKEKWVNEDNEFGQ